MSGKTSAEVVDPPVRRRKNLRSEQSIRKVLDATVQELTEVPYSDLTVRSVAARAGVSPTTAYTYFPSKEALVAEVYLRLLLDAPTFTDVNDSAATRVKAQLRSLLLLMADRPYLADACTIAIIADDPAVAAVRMKIAGEVGRRINASLGPGHPPVIAATLHMVFSGALLHARSTPGGYGAMTGALDEAVDLVLTQSGEKL
ncbi:TetR/AcrR family transcriptional regulator [Mycobacterium sp. DL592]|uniref:TetR/AcrR family transcriptional regulator n=1 Tax=Mycobacterium sp. DL592 TaxID=2675524 RepID=UPI001424130A|nr:TetR/AcrR family transcriptional regulator [Mycobacterium sp. DL592]